MKKIFLIVIFSIFVFAQAQTWEKTYPEYRPIFGDLAPFVFKQTQDNHFIWANVDINSENYLIKIDRNNGDIIFEKKFTFSSYFDNNPKDIVETDSGNFLITGVSVQGGGLQKGWLAKTDCLGNSLNQKIFVFGGDFYSGGFGKIIKLDSTYLALGYTRVTGFTKTFEWLVEFNENLEIINQKIFDLEINSSFIQEDSSYFFCFSYLWVYNSYSIKIVKFEKNWNIVWEKIYHENDINGFRPENLQVGKNYYLTGRISLVPTILTIDKEDGTISKTNSFPNFPVFATVKNCFENNGSLFVFLQIGKELEYSTKITTFILTEDNQIIEHKEYDGYLSTPGNIQILKDKKHYLILAAKRGQGPKIIVDTLPTPLNTNIEIPNNLALYQNYPNPFNIETKITYQLPESEKIQICIYNLQGQKIKTLIQKSTGPGTYELSWNGLNEEGKEVSSGIYLYQLITPNHSLSKKMVLKK